MSIGVLEGPGKLVEGFEAALTYDYSAVVVVGAIRRAHRMFDRGYGTPAEILRAGVPSLGLAESRMRTWAEGQARNYTGIGHGRQRSGGLRQHFDGYATSPVAFSIGIAGTADWRTQKASPHCLTDNGVFDLTRGIDTFEQGPDDLVIIPGMPDPSIHEIVADDQRLARVFVTAAESKTFEQA